MGLIGDVWKGRGGEVETWNRVAPKTAQAPGQYVNLLKGVGEPEVAVAAFTCGIRKQESDISICCFALTQNTSDHSSQTPNSLK